MFLCFGQSDMEGFPRELRIGQRAGGRTLPVLAVDFPKQGRTSGNWYPAVPPLCRPSAGPARRIILGGLWFPICLNIKVGIVNVSVGGCKIELFMQDKYQEYAATAPKWMTNTIATYSGNPTNTSSRWRSWHNRTASSKAFCCIKAVEHERQAMAGQGQRHLRQPVERPQP